MSVAVNVCPVCQQPTELTRDPTPAERRAVADLKRTVRRVAAGEIIAQRSAS